jgi:hypothetical protein
MKRSIYYIAALLAALFMVPAIANADSDDSDSFGARFSAEADYKIGTNMHVFASEEVRLLGGSRFFDRSYTQVGYSYRFCQWLKAAVSYTAIAVQKTDEITRDSWLDWRHRFSGDIVASLKAGQWRFSLRERIQGTYRASEVNNFQQPQMAWVLRSRLKVAYVFRTVPLEPYVYVEPRLLLNGVKWSEESIGPDYEDARFLGNKDVYFNRYRAAIGLEWTLNSRNSIDFYGLFDNLYDKEIDARKEGSNKGVGLKLPVTGISANRLSVGIAYKYSF